MTALITAAMAAETTSAMTAVISFKLSLNDSSMTAAYVTTDVIAA